MKIPHLILILGICVSGVNSGHAATIAYYRAESTNGTALGTTITDSSGNGRDITVSGATAADKYKTIVANEPATILQTGSANATMLDIDTRGSADGGTLTATAASDAAWNNIFSGGAFTIEGWVSPKDYMYGGYVRLASRGNWNSTGWTLLLNPSSLTLVTGGVTHTLLTFTAPSYGQMNYFSVIGDASGNLSSSFGAATGTLVTAGYGHATDTTSVISFFQGSKTGHVLVDELRFSDTALTSDQLLTAVPEPTTFGLLGLGAVVMTAGLRNRRARHASKI